MTKPQIILDDKGNPAFAVIPWQLYKRSILFDPDLDLSDEELYDSAKLADEESFPIDVADRLLAGENAVKVFRAHRGMTQKQLAQEVGINAVYLSQIEAGRRNGSTQTLTRLAKSLNVNLDDLVWDAERENSSRRRAKTTEWFDVLNYLIEAVYLCIAYTPCWLRPQGAGPLHEASAFSWLNLWKPIFT